MIHVHSSIFECVYMEGAVDFPFCLPTTEEFYDLFADLYVTPQASQQEPPLVLLPLNPKDEKTTSEE